MKKIFTLLLSSMSSLSLLAFDGSRLTITTMGYNNNIKVDLDGRCLVIQNNEITLSNLPEGYHTVKIYRERKRDGWGFGFGRRQDVLYNTSVYMKRGFHVDITVNRFGKVFVDEQRMSRNDGWYNNDDDDDDDYDGDRHNGGEREHRYDNDRNDNNGGYDYGYNNVMSSSEFDQLKESLRREWFESNRVTSAKVVIDKNNFTSQQVKELLQLFTFENNKLDLAKYAYRNTVDKRNYFVVNDVFGFSSSRDELARFIRDFR